MFGCSESDNLVVLPGMAEAVERARKGLPCANSPSLKDTFAGARAADLNLLLVNNVRGRAERVTPRMTGHINGFGSTVCMACLRVARPGQTSGGHILEGLPYGTGASSCPAVRPQLVARHDAVVVAVGREFARAGGREVRVRREVQIRDPRRPLQRPRKVDAVVRIGLEEVLVEVSITNQESTQRLKRKQLDRYLEIRRRTMESVRGGPFNSVSSAVRKLWSNIGSDGILLRVERSTSGNLNLVLVCGDSLTLTRSIMAPASPNGSKVIKPSWLRDQLKEVVEPTVRNWETSTGFPARMVVFASQKLEAGTRVWLAQGKPRMTYGILPSPWNGADMADASTHGEAARELARARGLACDVDDCPLRPDNPVPVRTLGLVALYDTRGTAYPETVRGFRTVTGCNLSREPGTAVVFQTPAIFNAWRNKARVNRRRF